MAEQEQENGSHSIKERISVTVSPHLKKRNRELLDAHEFSSESELVTVALSEFYGRYDHMRDLEILKQQIEDLNSKYEILKRKMEENNKKRQPNP